MSSESACPSGCPTCAASKRHIATLAGSGWAGFNPLQHGEWRTCLEEWLAALPVARGGSPEPGDGTCVEISRCLAQAVEEERDWDDTLVVRLRVLSAMRVDTLGRVQLLLADDECSVYADCIPAHGNSATAVAACYGGAIADVRLRHCRTDVGRRHNAAAGEYMYVTRPRLVVVSYRDVTNDPTMLTAEHAVYINQLRAPRHIHIPETHGVEAPADVGIPPPGLLTPPRSPASAPASPCASDATAPGTPTSFHARRSPRGHSNTPATPVRTHHADSAHSPADSVTTVEGTGGEDDGDGDHGHHGGDGDQGDDDGHWQGCHTSCAGEDCHVIWARDAAGNLYVAGRMDPGAGNCVAREHANIDAGGVVTFNLRAILVDYPHAPDGADIDHMSNSHKRSLVYWYYARPVYGLAEPGVRGLHHACVLSVVRAAHPNPDGVPHRVRATRARVRVPVAVVAARCLLLSLPHAASRV